MSKLIYGGFFSGKLATIVYVLVGMPLMLLFLTTTGDAMAKCFKFIYWRFCCVLCLPPRRRVPVVPQHLRARSFRSCRTMSNPSKKWKKYVGQKWNKETPGKISINGEKKRNKCYWKEYIDEKTKVRSGNIGIIFLLRIPPLLTDENKEIAE